MENFNEEEFQSLCKLYDDEEMKMNEYYMEHRRRMRKLSEQIEQYSGLIGSMRYRLVYASFILPHVRDHEEIDARICRNICKSYNEYRKHFDYCGDLKIYICPWSERLDILRCRYKSHLKIKLGNIEFHRKIHEKKMKEILNEMLYSPDCIARFYLNNVDEITKVHFNF